MRLNRAQHGRPAAPSRIVHLGIGNFARAHLCDYTERAPDAAQWGITAFTGRSPRTAHELEAQGGVYQLCVVGPEADEVSVNSTLTAVHPADDLAAWVAATSDPATAIITITVTEAGYRRHASGDLDLTAADVSADIGQLRHAGTVATVTTAPGKLLLAAFARCEAGAAPVAFVSLDNIAGNGPMLERLLTSGAKAIGPELEDWLDQCSFVTTMVDRITPATTEADSARVEAITGVSDTCLVVTEPFTEWVLSGDFPAGRPAWEAAGAQFVDDIEPFERRKLYLLNGGHSLLAYAGPTRGHETVADAIADPVVLGWVEQWWAEATPAIGLPEAEIEAYCAELLKRWRNPRLVDKLSRIAMDGSVKLPIRIVPTLTYHLARGDIAEGAVRVIAAWVRHLQRGNVVDPNAEALADIIRHQEGVALEDLLLRLDVYTPKMHDALAASLRNSFWVRLDRGTTAEG